MDQFILNTSNSPFFENKIYSAGESINFFIPNPEMMNEIFITNQSSNPNPQLTRAEQKQIKQNEKFKNALEAVLNMPDEDDTIGKVHIKIQDKIIKDEKKEEKRVDKFEKIRIDAQQTALAKYQDKCDLMREELIEKGFSEYDSKKLCGKCKYPKPFHIDYRPLVEETSHRFKQGYRFSAFCHSCINKGKVMIDNDTECKEIVSNDIKTYYKLHACNMKCKCGAIIQILDTAKEQHSAFKKHLDSKRHMAWEMIKHEIEYGRGGEDRNEGISFKEFNVEQLRHLIINNKKDGKCIMPNYIKKKKAELVEALEANRQYIDIDYDILDIGNKTYKKKEKPLGSAYLEYVNKYSDELEKDGYNSEDSLEDTPIGRFKGEYEEED